MLTSLTALAVQHPSRLERCPFLCARVLRRLWWKAFKLRLRRITSPIYPRTAARRSLLRSSTPSHLHSPAILPYSPHHQFSSCGPLLGNTPVGARTSAGHSSALQPASSPATRARPVLVPRCQDVHFAFLHPPFSPLKLSSADPALLMTSLGFLPTFHENRCRRASSTLLIFFRRCPSGSPQHTSLPPHCPSPRLPSMLRRLCLPQTRMRVRRR